MSKPDHQWIQIRRLALERDDGTCQVCGGPASDVHHRKPRSIGPSTVDRYGLANLVSVCRRCHQALEHRPMSSFELGRLVHASAVSERIPMFGIDGWTLYAQDGTKRRATPGEINAWKHLC